MTKEEKRSVMELLRRLNLQDRHENKLTPAEFLQVRPTLKPDQDLQESDLCSVYLYKLLLLDYRARYIQAKQEKTNACVQNETDDFFDLTGMTGSLSDQTNIHPLDLQMAVFHCSDSFLKQMMVTKLSQCQYALPLLVPNPFTGDIECPLWTFQQIKKTWKKTTVNKDKTNTVTLKSISICKAETPMVLCFRLGSLSVSKSQLINPVINNRHNTFFHRNCDSSSKTRLLFDGVAEIAWYCPAGTTDDSFTDCVSFCNLHGDALTYNEQLEILMEKSSVNVVFVPTLDQKHESGVLIQRLSASPKPLIVLIENISKEVTQRKPGKYIVGLKDRSQSNVSKDLRDTLKDILSQPHESFQLESMSDSQSMSDSGLRVDERDTSSRKGLSSAREIMTTMDSVPVSDVKKKFLPCQGQLWHVWSSTNKERFKLQGKGEEEKSKKTKECDELQKKLREKQCEASCGELMKTFLKHISSLHPKEREYFLKWTQILLDDYAVNRLSSILQIYNQKWSEVLDLQKPLDEKKSGDSDQKKSLDKLKSKQDELAKISQELQSATCGLEHIFREMAQIYEAHKDLNKPPRQGPTDWSKYPALAAELMISGHPMELMDGDAGHVPLTWILNLLDQVAQKLGDKKVFVLSVLGIQSSGKSTMLNAMFGLQFAVSAGRCTRGAFMQLVKLSEDMKKTGFQWDYILVVDTEGLRALELEGNKTIQHDNELATFVVGLGNMTLVNIFGENPSDMQDVLQIVVQAFMRMKKVKLSPSCAFVHQNVTDVSASEQNMDGKRKLQEKLNVMVKLAAEEEVCDAESFSDIIEFDVQKDVKYFTQLWEGSPPMAPPNPGYSESVQDLKSFILEKAKQSPGVSLSAFKMKVEDLWNALLSENFVFSFKNTQEITVYRKLEVEYGNWTWDLRKAMLKIEEDLYRQIKNGKLYKPIEVSDLQDKISTKYKDIQDSMTKYFANENDKDMLNQWQGQHERKITNFLEDLVRGLQRKLNNVIEQKKATADVEKRKADFESNLLQQSKKLALQLKDKSPDDHVLYKQFNDDWEKRVSELTRGLNPPEEINLQEDQIKAIHELGFEMDLIRNQKHSQQYKRMLEQTDYTDYVGQKRNEKQNLFVELWDTVKKTVLTSRLAPHYQEQIRNLITTVQQQASITIEEKPIKERGYSSAYLREMSSDVIKSIKEIERQWKQPLKKEFTVDLILFVFHKREKWILDSHSEFIRNNDVRTYLQSKKDEYFSVFRSYCKGSSSTVVLAERVSKKLKDSMIDEAYNKTAIAIADDMRLNVPAFKENKLNLDKHILKSLAEKKDFNRYITYIRHPKTYTETFIKEEVENLIQSKYKDKGRSFLHQNIASIHREILHALYVATETTKGQKGDIKSWLQKFTYVTIKPEPFSDVNDFDFLEDEIKKALKIISADLKNLPDNKFRGSRQQPDQLLIKQLCDCCWEKCPFCYAVCTNTYKEHPGIDHSNPFHRSPSLSGNHYWKLDEMWVKFCTTDIVSDGSFHPRSEERSVPFKSYRTAGDPFDKWSITPEKKPLLYWQWVVCTFKDDLEKHYSLKYKGHGKIPSEWFNIEKPKAIAHLEEHYK